MKFRILSCAILSWCVASCHKEEVKQPVNLELRHAALRLIKENMAGNWELRLEKGGFTGGLNRSYTAGENKWSFSIDATRLTQTFQNKIIADTIIAWSNVKTSFGDSAYHFSYFDKQGFPNNIIPDKIRNDTLVLFDDAIDGITHYLIKN